MNGGSGQGADEFRPSDILDIDDGTESDDEILRKFKNKPSRSIDNNRQLVSNIQRVNQAPINAQRAAYYQNP